MRSPVGDIASPIQSFFALVADDPSVQIVNSAQSWYVRRLAASDAGAEGPRHPVRRGAVQIGGRGGPDYYTDVKAGPIAIKDVADIYSIPTACAW